MTDEFKQATQDLQDAVDEVLAKFDEVPHLKSSPELALVKTHLKAAQERIKQELVKYVTPPADIVPEPTTQDPATNGQLGIPDAPGVVPEPTSEPTEGSTQSDEKTSTEQETPSTDTETSAPAQTPEAAQPTSAPEAGAQVSTPANQTGTPVVQPEPTGTDTTLNGQVASNTPSGQPVPSTNETATA
jgi:hypothetical protein